MIPLDPVPHPIDHLTSRGRFGDAALQTREGMLDYAGLEAAVGALAAWLAERGLAPGDRLATWLPKTRVACLMPLAAARAGFVHVPVNPLLKHLQVEHILRDSGARLLLTQPERAATLTLADCAVATAEPPLDGDRLPPSAADPQALAALLYTSGSTGQPKGVMLSHANLWLGAISVAHYLKLAPADRVLGVLPLSFDYGQNQLFSTWAAGGCVVPFDYLLPRDVYRAIARERITTLAGVPPLWAQLLDVVDQESDISSLKRLTNSGGALTRRLIDGLRSRFASADIYAMYGITEAFRSTYLDPALIDAHPDAVGTAIPFAEVAVVRPDGSRAAPGETGEIVHAGPLVSLGYWHDAARMPERYHPAPDWFDDRGTAVYSGDLGTIGADGLLRFVARDDEMIKSAGNRISPTEIEDAVTADGEVREAAAFGVPDERLGQAIVVVAAGDGSVEAGLRERLRRDLPGFMQPVRYVWLTSLPRNANGKLDRAGMRGMTS
ncbi:MAG: AMP-binding protein [Sphingomonas sp.]|uniref:AMP-binding protein n=1 Tax=Sphingomonas sp. TaxID=28214 RepID=UPI001ACF36DF|nr:AMP-binding protein [Sphingomonas sp.]MBN8807692.1 AMP-binding protein [Sphingomonas sp.]